MKYIVVDLFDVGILGVNAIAFSSDSLTECYQFIANTEENDPYSYNFQVYEKR